MILELDSEVGRLVSLIMTHHILIRKVHKPQNAGTKCKSKKLPRKLKLIKKPFQDIFNNKRRNKKKTYRTVHFIRENSFLGKYKN